jgi:membrane-associated phospholipid phosphatase
MKIPKNILQHYKSPWTFITYLGVLAGIGIFVEGLTFDVGSGQELQTLVTLWGFVFAVLIYCRFRVPFFYKLLYGPFALYCTGIIFSVIQCTFVNFSDKTFDFQFLSMDRTIFGVDWKSMHDWVWNNPTLAKSLASAYSILLSQMVVLTALVGVKDMNRLREFLIANVLCVILVLFFFGIFPAYGPEHTLGIPMSPYLENSFKLYSSLRSGMKEISFANTGMVTFPSYHAALAVLTMFVVGRMAIWIKWPVWILQGAIIVSTPPMGGHYVTDVAIGIILAVISIYLVRGQYEKI